MASRQCVRRRTHEKMCLLTPGLHYQGKYVLGNASNQETSCPATSILALMVNLFFCAPAFVARLIPVHKFRSQFFVRPAYSVTPLYSQQWGICIRFKLLHQMFQSLSIFSVVHPIPNVKFQALYCLYDPTYLFKNIRNNWVTENTQTLDFFCPSTNQKLSASWKDLITIYKSESSGSCLTNTKLDHQTLYPNNFEKQKDHLVVNVFYEKTCVALAQRKMYGTYKIVDNITKMWNILNIKTPTSGRNLNDKNREPFRDPNDMRLKFLENIATSFKKMDNSFVGHRMRGLTVDTSNALHQTLNGIVELVKTLLSCFTR